MACWNFKELKEHIGHKLSCVLYGTESVCIECNDCNEILIEFIDEGI